VRTSNQAMRKLTDKSIIAIFCQGKTTFKRSVFRERVRDVINIFFNDSVFECEILYWW
jgi:hypothetical protein